MTPPNTANSSGLAGSAPLRILFRTQFGLYVGGNTLSLIGTWMQRIACSWLVWDMTQSAFWVGILAACDLLPVVVISPFAGVAADRWDRLRLNLAAQILSIINALMLATLLLSGHLGLTMILTLTLVQGILTAATQPSRFAMVQQMVSRNDVGAAVGLNSAFVNVARLLGPALAGILMVRWDSAIVFVANALITLSFLPILLNLKLSPGPKKDREAAFLSQLIAGYRYIIDAQALRLILLAMFAGGALVRSVVELMPVIATRAFGHDVSSLAILTAATAAGAIGAGMTVKQRDVGDLLKWAPIFWIAGALAAASLIHSPHPAWSILSAVALGAAVTKGLVSTQTYIQLTTPDELRGRALSVFGLIARGSPALGALGIGMLVDNFGLNGANLVASGVLLTVFAVLARPLRNALKSTPKHQPSA